MYRFSTKVFVREIVPNKLISIDWGEPATTVDFCFTAITDVRTLVVIKHYDFDLTGEDLMNAIKDSTSGFTTVLDGMKAWLEHNITLNLILDKFPKV